MNDLTCNEQVPGDKVPKQKFEKNTKDFCYNTPDKKNNFAQFQAVLSPQHLNMQNQAMPQTREESV